MTACGVLANDEGHEQPRMQARDGGSDYVSGKGHLEAATVGGVESGRYAEGDDFVADVIDGQRGEISTDAAGYIKVAHLGVPAGIILAKLSACYVWDYITTIARHYPTTPFTRMSTVPPVEVVAVALK